MQTANWHPRHAEVAATCWRAPFRGEIWDYCRKVWLGSSYVIPETHVCNPCKSKGIAHCRHFEIDTCRQLVGPMRAMRDPNVETVIILKAAQTLGSLSWDMAVHYFIAVSPYMTIAVFLENDQKALSYADKRLMPTLKANPDIAPLLPTGIDRYDASKREIKFTNGKILSVMGLNETNASSLSWEVVIVDEGWQHGSDGLMQKARDRTKQVARRKVIICGQAGEDDGDQNQFFWKLAHQVPITFACPQCGHRQEFSLGKARPSDFEAATPELTQRLKADPVYGLRVAEQTSELNTPEAILSAARGAYLECYQCGHHIKDTPEERRAIMATYRQDYQPHGYTPKGFTVGFWMPDPASVTVPFSATMNAYLLAEKARQEGNLVPLHDFHINRWATAWNDRMVHNMVKAVTLTYDPTGAITGEVFRMGQVDCQMDVQLSNASGQQMTGHFWVTAWAVDRSSAMIQLWRGYCTSWDEWIKKFKELKIPTQNIGVDGGFKPDEVKLNAARNAELVFDRNLGRKVWHTWTMMLGDDAWSFAWPDNQRRPYSEPKQEILDVQGPDGKWRPMIVNVIRWSNFRLKNQLDIILRGLPGAPKMSVLPQDSHLLTQKTREMEHGDYTWDGQMNSEILGEERKRKKWIAIHPQNHYRDTTCQGIVFMMRAGLLGQALEEVNAKEG